MFSCAGSCRGAASVENASAVVEEAHRRRTLVKISELIRSDAIGRDSGELALEVRAKIDDILNDGKSESYDLSALVAAISDRLDKPEKQAKPRTTGLRRLDHFLNGGFRPGRLVVVGARSSHGKTAFGIGNLALSAAEAGFRVSIITLEMTPDELAARFLTSSGGVPVEEIIASRISPSNMRHFTRGAAALDGLKVEIIPPRNRKLSNIIRIIRQTVRRAGAQIIFLDYLQLIRHDNHAIKRYEAVAEISGELKALSQELDVPIVVLAQLNREADGEIPRAAHLRESGAIEQDADEILLIHRPDDEDGVPQDLGYIIVDKNRNGRRGKVSVQFIGDRCAFSETDQQPIATSKRRTK